MSTTATIKIKDADVAVYVHWDGYDLANLCEKICTALKNNYGDVRVDNDPAYATMRMVDTIIKTEEYDGLGYGLVASDCTEDYNYVIYSDGDNVTWSCEELDNKEPDD